MSEKQFKLSSETVLQYQIMDNDTDLNENEVVDLLNELSEKNEQLKAKASSWKITCSQEMNEKNVLFMKNRQLQEENEKLKNKLNVIALELVDEAISMGKAVEISEMSYREFIDYRAENGKPMELQL